MKQKVVILSAFASPFRSGAEACSEEVAGLLQDEYDITIVTARLRPDLPREDTLANGVKVLRVGIGRPLDKWLFPFAGALKVRKLRPALVHAILESYAGLALVFSRWLHPAGRRVLTCQSTNTSLLLGSMHRHADAVTVISTPLLQRAAKLGRADAVLIPNGIHAAVIQDTAKRVSRTPHRILFVGRLERMKGIDTLLRAFAFLISEHPAHLRIVGAGSQLDRLHRLTAELGIGAFVTFAGPVHPSKVAEEFAAAEVFCGLSRSEALGNVFLEAQAAGCAVVATNVGGIPDIVIEGVTGLLVPSDRPQAATAALHKVLTDKKLREQFSSEGVRHAAGYDWSAIAPRYAEVYRKTMVA